MICMSLCILLLIGCNIDQHKNEAKTPSASELKKGSHYEKVVQAFETAGFTNIQTEKIEDLIVGWFKNDGDIASITLDGDEDFSPDTWYPNDVEVVIAYHTFPADDELNQDEENNEASNNNHNEEDKVSTAEEIYDDAIGKLAIEVHDALKEEKYTVTFLHEITQMDFSEEVLARSDPDDEESYLPWEIVALGDFNEDKKSASFLINTEEMMDEAAVDKEVRNALVEKLPPSHAWGAVTDYGMDQYKYGFKLNMITGMMAESVFDEATWFLKSRCQTRNEAGIWQKNLICEAYVTGTEDDPEIIDFKVYE